MLSIVGGINFLRDMARKEAAEGWTCLAEGNEIDASDHFGTANGILKSIAVFEQVKAEMASNN
jgi:hypothetical protein